MTSSMIWMSMVHQRQMEVQVRAQALLRSTRISSKEVKKNMKLLHQQAQEGRTIENFSKPTASQLQRLLNHQNPSKFSQM